LPPPVAVRVCCVVRCKVRATCTVIRCCAWVTGCVPVRMKVAPLLWSRWISITNDGKHQFGVSQRRLAEEKHGSSLSQLVFPLGRVRWLRESNCLLHLAAVIARLPNLVSSCCCCPTCLVHSIHWQWLYLGAEACPLEMA